MLPDHCPDIDDMTGTFVEITMHVRELKALIWRVECVIRGGLEKVGAYGVPWWQEEGSFGKLEEEGVSSVEIGGDSEPAMPMDREELPYGAKKEKAQGNTREVDRNERVTPSKKFIHTPNTATNVTGFSTHNIGKFYQVTPAEQAIHIPTSTPARETVEYPPDTISANKKYQEQCMVHTPKETIKLAAKQAAFFASTQISEGNRGANSDDNENGGISTSESTNTADDHRSEDKTAAAAGNEVMDRAQMSLTRHADEVAAPFAARPSSGDDIDDEVQTHVARAASNEPADADDKTTTEQNEAFDGGLMEDALIVVLRVAAEGAAMFSAETLVEDDYDNMLADDMRRAVIDDKVETHRVHTAPNQAVSTAAKAIQGASEKLDSGLIDDSQGAVLRLIAEGAEMFAAEKMAADRYEKTAAEDVQRATIKRAAEEAAGLAAVFQTGGGDDEKDPLVDVSVEAKTQALLNSSESLPAEETAEENEGMHDAERREYERITEDQRALVRFAAEEAAAFAITLIGGAESGEGEAATIGVVGVSQGESIDDDQKAVVKRAAEEAAAFAVTLMGQTEGGEREVASNHVKGNGQCEPAVDDQKSIVKHAAQQAASFAASFVALRDRETEDIGGSEKGAEKRYAEMRKGNGGSWLIIGTESSDGVRDNNYEELCEGLSALGPTSYDENWVDEEMERDNEERMNDGMCVAT